MDSQEVKEAAREWRDEAMKQWRAFLKRWPIEKLPSLTLKEYTDSGNSKDYFCYWLEFGTKRIYGIAGGSAIKFGVYWSAEQNKYVTTKGQDPKQAFKKVKELIVNTAQAARQHDFSKLIELSKSTTHEVLLWKVAYLYQDINHPWLFPFGARNYFTRMFHKETSVAEGQKRLQEEIRGQDYWEFSERMQLLAEKRRPKTGATGNAIDDDLQIDHLNPEIYQALEILKYKKNAILVGAPGTGKTYSTKEIAVRLCLEGDAKYSDEIDIEQEYQRLVNERRIRFTTFHPSMDYEDFIEGYKPVSDTDGEQSGGGVRYEVVSGIFQQCCLDAKVKEIDRAQGIRDNATVWKVSLKKAGPNEVRDYCLAHDAIRIGWDDFGEDPESVVSDGGYVPEPVTAFINKMQIGDLVVSCYSSTQTDAVGVIVSDYQWDDSLPEYKRLRHVKWLYRGKPIDVLSLNNQTSLTLSTVYKLQTTAAEVLNFLRENGVEKSKPLDNKRLPYVLIIDEINRGNVAKIFGELITLIEVDKRDKGIGASGVSVVLPYSKKTFSVPDNLYILGTMNTADRSIGNIDYAVRRRFGFVQFYPHAVDSEDFDKELFFLVSRLFVENPEVDDKSELKPSQFLNPDYDFADVWLGQSYFFKTEDDDTRIRWQYDIRPILDEYIKDEVLFPSAREEIERIEHEYFKTGEVKEQAEE